MDDTLERLRRLVARDAAAPKPAPTTWLDRLTALRATEAAALGEVAAMVEAAAGGARLRLSASTQVMFEGGWFALSSVQDVDATARELGTATFRIWVIEIDAAVSNGIGLQFKLTSYSEGWEVVVRGGDCLVRNRKFTDSAEMSDFVAAILPRLMPRDDEAAGQDVGTSSDTERLPSPEEADALAAKWAAEAAFPPKEPSMADIHASIRRIIDGAKEPKAPLPPETRSDPAMASAQEREIEALRLRVAYLEGRLDEQSRLLQTLVT
jgi:hypothetical protein